MEKAKDLVFVTAPAAGNEPFLLAVAVAKAVNRKLIAKGVQPGKIVVPANTGQVKAILENEHGSDLDEVFLDAEYGRIIQETLASQGDFRVHMQKVLRASMDVDVALQQRFSRAAGTFRARALGEDRDCDLPTTNMVSLDIAPRFAIRDAISSHFIFPVLISELMVAVQQENFGLSVSDVEYFRKFMFGFEVLYKNVFISRIGTLSGREAAQLPEDASLEEKYTSLTRLSARENARSRIYTPGMGRGSVERKSVLMEDALYAMFSGTGSAIAETKAHVEALLAEGSQVLVPEWMRSIEGTKPTAPHMLFDPRVQAVIARSGFGTIWKAMRANLPFLAVPYREGDDPEIYFNDQTVDRFGLGIVLPSSPLSRAEIDRAIEKSKGNIRRVNELTQAEFGTTDGVEFVAEEIAKTIVMS